MLQINYITNLEKFQIHEKLVSMTIEIRERHNYNISFEVFRFFKNFLLLLDPKHYIHKLDGNKKLHNKLADMPL